MDLGLTLLGSLAAAMALETAPDPAPVSPQETPVSCDDTDGDQAKAKCRRDSNAVDSITVNGQRKPTESPLEPDLTLDEAAIASLGGNTISELLVQLEPLTRSARGRGNDEPPVVLINGQRTTGFQETGSIPREAIKKIDLLKEEAALAYGFRADQRVMNFVLKDNFRAVTVTADARRATRGGRAGTEQRLSTFKVDKTARWTAELRYRRDSPLFESERGVVRAPDGAPYDLTGNIVAPSGEIDPALSKLAGATVSTAVVPTVAASGKPALGDFAAGAGTVATDDLTASRTLLYRVDEVGAEGAYTRNFGVNTATLSGGLTRTNRVGYRGLTGAAIPIAAGSPFSPFANDVVLYRYLGGRDALRTKSDTDTLRLGTVVMGMWSGWRWTASGNLDRTDIASVIGRGVDVSAFRAAVAAGTVNPFGVVPASLLTTLSPDTADSVITNIKGEVTLTGGLAELPAGRLRATVKGGVDRRRAESESVRSGVSTARVLTRDRATGFASVDLPIASRQVGVLSFLGEVSLNANTTYEQFSDLGGLVTAGGGVTWTPRKGLTLTANYSSEEGEPSLNQLNDPVIQTQAVSMYDFATGQSVNVTQTRGGNPALTPDSRQVVKLSLNYKPFEKKDLSFSASYVASRIDDQIAEFPAISPELEAAFPQRFTRDATGQLVAVDLRPVNFAYEDKRELSWGLRYYKRLGAPAPPIGKGGSITFTPQQGYINVTLDHVWRLRDEVVIRQGMAPLDLLDGASLGQRGGKPRHEVTLQTFFGLNGVGGFVRGTWKSATRVDGGPRGEDLRFSDLALFTTQAWMDLGERKALAKDRPWLKGTRLTLTVENAFDTRQRVRDTQGRTPQAYQKGYMDPLGRAVRLGLRKQF